MKSRKRSFFQRTEAVLLSAVLIVGMLSSTMQVTVMAQEDEDKKASTLLVSEFVGLPEDVRQQTVPVGTPIEDLLLPDTLESVIWLQDSEGITEEEEGAAVDTPVQSEDTDEPGQEEENPDFVQDKQEPESGEKTELEKDTQEPEPEEGLDSEKDTSKPEESEDSEKDTPKPEESEDLEKDTPEPEEGVETQSVSLQEYYTENKVTVKTLEDTQESETKEHQAGGNEITPISGVAWEPEPEYDGNVEGTYYFTAVLPEGYAPVQGVGLPEIIVMVGGDSEDGVRTILDGIASLPDLDEYLAKEPDIEQEEDYEAWMTELQKFAQKALVLWEQYEALTGEEQAKISEEQITKLAAWVEFAGWLAKNSMVMTADISEDTTWTGTVSSVAITGSSSEQNPVVITVPGDVTVSGKITVNSGYVKITGGGSLKWNRTDRRSNAFEVLEGANVIFENVTLDGEEAGSFSGAALLLCGKVTFGSGTIIKNFSSNEGWGAGPGAKGVIAVYEKGELTILDGVSITGNVRDSGIIAIYQSDGGGGKSTAKVFMRGGEIKGNTVGNPELGVIWNWCGNLEISGGNVTAEGNEYAVHTQGNYGKYDATTVITGGSFIGNKLGAICAGKDSDNNSFITVTGGTFEGKDAATVNYGTINIEGGSYTGSEYALKTERPDGALNVSGGEFYGGMKAYSGNVNTQTNKVIVGNSKESAGNWDRITLLDTYQYVAIGELEAKHKHDVSVNTSANSDTQVNFTALDIATTLNSGSYYLESDKELTAPLDIPAGAVVNLCLNGHKLNYVGSGTGSFITVTGTLNLCDCNGSQGSHTFRSPATDEQVTLNGGLITRSMPVDAVGSGIRVYKGGILNFYGGSIAGISDTGTNGISNSHGAVRVEGTLQMYGGAITHNRSGCGGGVNICSDGSNACFYLHGGSISYNYADYDDGGGICLNARCSFEMDGGEIRGNRAKSGGGGIECYGTGDSADWVKLLGGVITENTTGGTVGGGIKCGDTGRPLTVSGEIQISGNKNVDDAESNLYLQSGKTVNVDSRLTGGAVIRVATEDKPTAENPVQITGTNSADYSRYFQSDDSAYTIENGENNTVQLVLVRSDKEKVEEAKKAVEGALAGVTFSNATTKESIQALINQALSAEGINSEDVTVTVGDLNKTEATSSAVGRIIGSISISSGSTQESVSIDKPIEKLPKTDAEKVEEAKRTVEGVLAGVTFSNDTTKESLQEVIDQALSDAGINSADVTVTVGDLNKIEATSSAVGNIKGSISISSGSKQESISIEETIAKLPKTDEEKVEEAKEAVEGALAGVTFSNATTKESLQAVIDQALSAAGINSADVTVTVGDLNKTEATSSAVGSIKGSISISSGSKQESISIEETIAKLPDTEENKPGGNPGGKPGGDTDKPEDNSHLTSGGGGGGASQESNSDDSGSTGSGQPQKPATSGAYDPALAETRVKSEQLGSIYKEVTIKAENSFDTAIATQIPELADMVLTEVEKQQAAGGTGVKIILKVQDARNVISSEDKALVEAAVSSSGLEGFAVGQYLDFHLSKIVGENHSAIQESNGKMTISITVPDSLKNTGDTKTRVFAVIRVYNGQAELLADLDDNDDTITIATDRFASYAIIYKDMGGAAKTSGTKDKEPKTGDAEPIELFATLSMVAGVSYLLMYFAERRHGMSEETKKEFVSRLARWARRGGKMRKLIAFIAIFVLLVYYHGIGKNICQTEKWKKEELKVCE